jgi:hypothetical protein
MIGEFKYGLSIRVCRDSPPFATAKRILFDRPQVCETGELRNSLTDPNSKIAVLWPLNIGYHDQLVVNKIVAEKRTNVWVVEKLGHRGLASRDYAVAFGERLTMA